MWCSKHHINNNNNNQQQNSSSSSSSILPLTPRRSMEEVWKDITFSPHLDPTTTTTTTTNSSKGIIFQDFFAGAFQESQPPSPPPLPHPFLINLQPPISLALSSSNNHADPTSRHIMPNCNHSAAGFFPVCSKKREAGDEQSGFGVGNERRQKRMIKNRESAARSRARKQAYTNELELEVRNLVEENEKLRRQYQKLQMAMAAQISNKSTLQRTSTAPF